MNQKQQEASIEQISKAIEELTLAHRTTGEALRKLSFEVEILKNGYGTARDNKPIVIRERKATREEYQGLIGSRVRIINPGKDEPDIGYVHSVGKLYITVEIPGALRKQRIAKNLRLLEHV